MNCDRCEIVDPSGGGSSWEEWILPPWVSWNLCQNCSLTVRAVLKNPRLWVAGAGREYCPSDEIKERW